MRLDEALRAARRGGRPALVPYLMVDRGRRRRFAATVEALRAGGAAALELGFPFSDPIADGPVLESAHGRAIAAGTDWADLVASVRTASRRLPTAVMTYANPLWSRGLDRAAAELARAGASALIVPDLSLEDAPPFRRAARRANLSLVLLAAPGLGPERTRRIAATSSGFLYLVSRYGTTGSGAGGAVDLAPSVRAAHDAAPGLPVLIGFGIRSPATVRSALRTGADGVVVGSALEEVLRRHPSPAFVRGWLDRLMPVGAPRSSGPAADPT